MLVVIVVGAVLAAALTYGVLEKLGRRAWLPGLFRAVAWGGMGVLLLNLSCPSPRSTGRPITLLDGSLSMRRDPAAFASLVDSLATRSDALFFGDDRPGALAVPRGRSLLGPALEALSAVGRPVEVVTDGEIEDATDLPPALVRGIGVSLVRAAAAPMVAIPRLSGTRRVTAGDSVVVEGEIYAYQGWTGDSAVVEARSGDLVLAREVVKPVAERNRFRVAFSSRRLSAGQHLVRLALAGTPDARLERWWHVTVVPTPGIVLLADPGDWDSRFLYRALGEVADLPLRGYVHLAGAEWRRMRDLAPVPLREVRRAARGADLLILKGGTERFAPRSRARGIWRWPSGEAGKPQVAGDWYLSPGPGSPIAGALAGVAVDSFPPAVQITPIQTEPGEWVGLLAQEARRGALRPVVTGGVRGGRRYATVSADGLWRWAFPGGSSEQGYRALVSALTTWLLGGVDSVAGRAAPVANVVANGTPILFRWQGGGQPAPLVVRLPLADSTLVDTLVFDGAGLARLWLSPGRYRYRLADGSGGLIGVERYSPEWLPRPVTLHPNSPPAVAGTVRTSAREGLWLFGLVVLALAAEWVTRRRLGLR